MRILIIDNNINPDCWGASDLCKFGAIIPGAAIYVRRAPHDDLPALNSSRNLRERYDRIIMSGSKTSTLDDSPWVHRLHEFIRGAVEQNIPLLGICYGHQALVRAMGGKEMVRKAKEPEFGWSEIEILKPSPLFQGLPQKFHSFSSHFEEVGSLPSSMKHLARSAVCEVQAFQLDDRRVFGIQFHPERNVPEAKKTLAERKKQGIKLIRPDDSDRVFDAKVGELIFKNFLTI